MRVAHNRPPEGQAIRYVLAFAIIFAHATGAAGSIVLFAVEGRDWFDFDLDGEFNDGVSPPGGLQSGPFSNFAAARGGILFSVADLPAVSAVGSAILTLHFSIVSDLNEPGNPDVELHGFTTGNNFVWHTDVEATNLLHGFSPQPDALFSFDVTSFVAAAQASGDPYFGFSVRIHDDLSTQERALAWFYAPTAVPTELRPLLAVSSVAVPEISSFATWALLTIYGLALAHQKQLYVVPQPPRSIM